MKLVLLWCAVFTPGSGKIAFTVHAIWGTTLSFHLKGSDTISRLGEYFERTRGISGFHRIFTHGPDRLREDQTVRECGIEEGDQLDLRFLSAGD